MSDCFKKGSNLPLTFLQFSLRHFSWQHRILLLVAHLRPLHRISTGLFALNSLNTTKIKSRPDPLLLKTKNLKGVPYSFADCVQDFLPCGQAEEELRDVLFHSS